MRLVHSIHRRYSNPMRSSHFVNPYTGVEIVFPPCFVVPETANQDFARGSKIHSQFVNPYVPDAVCFENLILDELMLFPGMSANIIDLRSAVLRDPFIVCDDSSSLLSVRVRGGGHE